MTRATEAKARHRIASELYHPIRNRRRRLTAWHAEGRIKITEKREGEPWPCMQVLVGTLYFRELKVDFPSEKLFAQVALAVEAGQGFAVFADVQIEDFKLDDPISMTPAQWARLGDRVPLKGVIKP